MKKFIIVFIILISFCLSAQQKHKIAILNYEDKSKNKKIEADTLLTATDYFRMYLEGKNNFEVIPKDQQKELTTCKDKLCRIKTGETLGAEIVAYLYITAADSQYIINVEFINVANRSTTISVSENWDGGTDSLDSISEAIVSKIAAKQANIDALNSNSSFRESVPQEEPTFAETFKVAYNTVRDTQTCEKAREKENLKLWQKYLKSFPEGQCVEEAKKFIEDYPKKLDNDACEKARKKNNESDWENYLKSFPEGQCTAEANESLDNIACTEAEDDNSLKGWKKYLDSFPNGKCSAKARENFSNRENIEKMMKKGRDMKIAGATLLTVGAVGFTLGFALGAAIPRHYEYCDNWGCHEKEDWDSSLALGWGIGGGIGGTMILIGIPLLSVGVIKEKEAKSYLKINNLAVVPQKGGAYATIGFNF